MTTFPITPQLDEDQYDQKEVDAILNYIADHLACEEPVTEKKELSKIEEYILQKALDKIKINDHAVDIWKFLIELGTVEQLDVFAHERNLIELSSWMLSNPCPF